MSNIYNSKTSIWILMNILFLMQKYVKLAWNCLVFKRKMSTNTIFIEA